MSADLGTKVLPDLGAPKPAPAPARREPAVAPTREGASRGRFAKELERAAEQAQSAKDAGREAATAQSSSTPKKADELAALKNAAGRERAVIDATPVLAFLTGHLEKLEPSQIPQLVSGNEFVKDALAHGDPGEFLSEIRTVGEWLEALDLPKDFAARAKALGLNLDAAVSAKDLFKALGVDPHRIQSELSILGDNLRTGGIAKYMQMAAAKKVASDPLLASRAPAITDPTTAKDEEKSVEDALAGAIGVGAGFGAGQATRAQSEKAQEIARTLATKPGMKQADQPEMPVMGTVSVSSDLGGTTNELAAPVMGVETLPRDFIARTAFEGKMPERIEMPTDVTLDVDSPRLARTQEDPFQMMGRRLEQVDAMRVRPQAHESGDRVTATVEELLASGFTVKPDARPESLGVATSASALDAMAQGAPIDMPAPEPHQVEMPVTPEAVESGELPSYADRIGLNRPRMTTEAPKVEAPRSTSVPVEDLRFDLSALRFGHQEGDTASDFGRDFGEREGDGLRDQSGQDLLRNVLDTMQASSPERVTFQVQGASEAFTPDAVATLDRGERAEAVQQLMDQALALVRRGGGAVQLGIGTEKLGRVELAVQLDGDRVDVRILTESNDARDLIVSEIGRLRDALAVQNLKMGDVDVGVGGRDQQQASQFAWNGDGGRREMSDRREWSERMAQASGRMLHGAERVTATASPRIRTYGTGLLTVPQTSGYSETGRIEVRV